MDFDIGNCLYVIITLIAVIAGLVGRRKKKTEGSGAEGEQAEAQPGFMEGLENLLKMGQEEPTVTDLETYEEDLPSEIEPVMDISSEEEDSGYERPAQLNEYERILQNLQQRENDIILSDSDNIDEPLEVIHLEEEEGTDYFEIVKDFDAGTAVVYSAIINRVDY
jgi:hypothetical protein